MKYLLISIILLLTIQAKTQEKLLDKAQEFYSVQQYKQALDYFLEAELLLTEKQAKEKEIWLKIASCYSNLHMPSSATTYYEKAQTAGVDLTTDQFLDYANSLIELGNYFKAKEIVLNKGEGLYLEQILLDKCDFALNNNQSNDKVILLPVPQPKDYSTYGMTIYKGKLLSVLHYDFTKNAKNEEYLFVYEGSDGGFLERLQEIDLPLNFNFPSIDTTKNTIYFSGNASNNLKFYDNRKDQKKIGTGGINNLFIWCLLPGKAPDALHLLPFNNVDYSCTHPFITDGGNTLYFSSNMLGGYGGFDLYKIVKDGDDWGEPINLGRKVNTFLNDGYPFMKDGILFFSSEGHPGYGGLDIFKTDLESGVIENIGKPYNSSCDDFSFVQISSDDGFFLSNRLAEDGKDRMYKFIIGDYY